MYQFFCEKWGKFFRFAIMRKRFSNYRFSCIYIFSLLLFPGFCISQGKAIKYLGIENGLSNNYVTSIYQDEKGFMWFGTYDGLNRYDGYNFTTYRHLIGDSTSLCDNSINCIMTDAAHHVLIGTHNGLSMYDAGTQTFSGISYPGSDVKGRNRIEGFITYLKQCGTNTLVGTYHSVIALQANSHSGRQIPLQSGQVTEHDYDSRAIAWDPARELAWVFIENEGLALYDAKKGTMHLVNRDIKNGISLQLDQDGNLWVGNSNGLYYYDTRAGRYTGLHYLDNVKVVALCLDKLHALWIATDGTGLWILSPAAGHPEATGMVKKEEGIGSNAVYAIYDDSAGRKWVGTLRDGINIIERVPSPFRKMVMDPQQSAGGMKDFILSFGETPDHNVWIGTDGSGLRYWNRADNRFVEYSAHPSVATALSSNFITNITTDFEGRTWFSTWFGGIDRFNKAKGTFEHFSCLNPYTRQEEKNVWLLYEDTYKTLWASTVNSGTLYTFSRKTRQFEIFDPSIADVQCLTEDREGNLWGGNYNSLIRIDRVNKRHIFYRIGYTVRSICEDRTGNFWVGTDGGGLLCVDRKTGHYVQYSTSQGLPNNSVLRILEDDKGNLWLSTFNGLSKFSPQHRLFQNFVQSDGLQSNQFAYNAALALHSGEFLFGGIRGFNIFYPDSVHAQYDMPPIFLTDIRINNKAVKMNDPQVSAGRGEDFITLTIPFDRANLAFDFTALEYSYPDKISYAFHLKEWDKNWHYADFKSRTANYLRLQEGHYTLEMKNTDAAGKWGPVKTMLQIIVLPPWYRSWWAWCCYALLVFLALYAYTYYKSRQTRLEHQVALAALNSEKEKEVNERKLSFFTHVSHEFRTPITLIINPLKEQIARLGKGGGPASAKAAAGEEREEETGIGIDSLTTAYRNARRLLSLVDQLLLFRKADSGEDILKISRIDIVELCREVYQCFIQQARMKNMDYRILPPVHPIELYVDHEKIEIALFNLLSNAFKFTPDGGKILLMLRDGEDEVKISVEDSGCGIEKEESLHIFNKFRQGNTPGKHKETGFGIGLYLVKRFVEDHTGTVKCESVVQQGTTFTISLKKGMQHLPATHVLRDADERHTLLEELAVETEPADRPETDVPVVLQGLMAEELVTEKKSILLIDDNTEIRQYLKHLFAGKYLLFEADNGDAGFTLAREEVPDLIISDIQMSGMDGVELCARIKSSESLSHIPVILLTAASGDEVKLKGIEKGADDYITKPFDSTLLMAKVEAILRNRNILQKYFFDSVTLKETKIKVPAEYRDFLRKCIEVVEANIDTEDFTIKKFSKAMGMSHSGLYQKIKSISGQSVIAFIRSIRLRRAAVLMLHDEMPINQAAFQVGIGDVRYFREQFVRLFGMVPSEYIKRFRSSFNRDLHVIKPEEGRKL